MLNGSYWKGIKSHQKVFSASPLPEHHCLPLGLVHNGLGTAGLQLCHNSHFQTLQKPGRVAAPNEEPGKAGGLHKVLCGMKKWLTPIRQSINFHCLQTGFGVFSLYKAWCFRHLTRSYLLVWLRYFHIFVTHPAVFILLNTPTKATSPTLSYLCNKQFGLGQKGNCSFPSADPSRTSYC